ncbi:hypothetical protein [Frankia sp. AiPa1]|nr:hypothetical protein [Frankia sp. AiPa1]
MTGLQRRASGHGRSWYGGTVQTVLDRLFTAADQDDAVLRTLRL